MTPEENERDENAIFGFVVLIVTFAIMAIILAIVFGWLFMGFLTILIGAM